VRPFTRAKPVRAPLPDHLPRERVVVAAPSACPCCGGKLAKLGETITETLESIPRSYKVIQTVREKFSCRSCEKITQPPAPFRPIARGRAGPELLATVMHAKFGEHQPLNRQSERFAAEGIDLSVSTLADWVGGCTAARFCQVWRQRNDFWNLLASVGARHERSWRCEHRICQHIANTGGFGASPDRTSDRRALDGCDP
jgi:transposase